MHQVIGKEPAILTFEPRQDRPDHDQAQPADEGHLRHRQNRPDTARHHQGQRQLDQQEHNRIEGRDHRPLAQPHQPEQRPRPDIGPCGADQLAIGRDDPLIHRPAHNVGPDQHLKIRMGRCAIDHRIDLPAVIAAPATGLQGQVIARDARLIRAFLAIEFAIAARVDRVIARDVKHLAPMHLNHD